MPKKNPAVPTPPNQIDAYTHDDKSRANIPPVGMAQYDMAASPEGQYEYDPHLDPALQWAGKKEGASFTVPTSSIHIHESIKPHKIIRSVQNTAIEAEGLQGNLFESDAERAKRRNDAIEFYQHKDKWTNRLIAGDSLVIINSLLEKEGMAGLVQMVYIDPPYGIKYGSNFQPFVNKRDVKDKKDEDLSSEPEMIKAFRDTWELGIHSYLTYLRDRLKLAHELLADTGSVFVQISDENVHLVRCILDELFGKENFVSIITVQKTSSQTDKYIATSGDYIILYAKNKNVLKYRQLYIQKIGVGVYNRIELSDGTRRIATQEERDGNIPENTRLYATGDLTSSHEYSLGKQEIEFEGRKYTPGPRYWTTSPEGFERLKNAKRLIHSGISLRYIRYFDDFPAIPINNIWTDTTTGGFNEQKIYAVQTSAKVISRCLLMTTDPGDLVLDITCGSGTTAYVAEQWGRRWITCDTSRIAITLAKKRLMTAVFPYYKIKECGPRITRMDTDKEISENPCNPWTNNNPSNGFVYKTVPHITLKSIANNEPPEQETLYDQPEIEKRKVRIVCPFTVEALPAPVVKPLESADDSPAPFFHENAAKKQAGWMDELRAAGILGRGGEKIQFSRVEALSGASFIHADAETREPNPRRAIVHFTGETKPLDMRMVNLAMKEAENQRPTPALLIFAYFQADPAAAEYIEKTNWLGVTLLKVQMNTDLMTADLKKKSSGSQSFWLIGQPDVELVKISPRITPINTEGKVSENPCQSVDDQQAKYKVCVLGFDYYDVKAGKVESGGTEKIAMWMLDTDYDGMAIEPRQVFFPMEGKNEGWDKLAKTLRAEIDPDLIEKYRGVESLPFTVKENSLIAVKIVDDRGIESLKVIPVGESPRMDTDCHG